MPSPYRIRAADAHDLDRLVEFTLQEAVDAEGRTLDRAGVTRGVEMALDDPSLARYWIGEAADGEVAGSISTTTEWSNFHGGHYWWVQSLFVRAEHRGRGLVDVLLDHAAAVAAGEGAIDLRLHAHQDNDRARRAYTRRGFTNAPYVLMVRPVRPSSDT